jgi:hypothetical protein
LEKKDPGGGWYSTTPTILALKALMMGFSGSETTTNAEIEVLVDGKSAGNLVVTPETSDVTQTLNISQFVKEGGSNVQLKLAGKGTLLYQLVTRYFLPWEKAPVQVADVMELSVAYDKTRLAKDDYVTCTATVKNVTQAELSMVMVDLGVPPGFQVQSDDLAELVGSKVIQKFTVYGRQVTLYFDKLAAGQEIKLKYRLQAKYPIKAKTPASRAWQYYNPEEDQVAQPIELIVE